MQVMIYIHKETQPEFEDFKIILKEKGLSFSGFVNEAIINYLQLNHDSGPQKHLDSYSEKDSSKLSPQQKYSKIRDQCLLRYEKYGEIRQKDLIEICRENGIDPNKIPKICSRLVKYLTEQKITVIF